jgi:hypothetical protein
VVVGLPDLAVFVFCSLSSVTTTLLVWLLDAGVRFPFVGGVPFFCSISVDLVFRFFLLCSRSSGFSIFCFRVWCFYGSCVPFIFIYLFTFIFGSVPLAVFLGGAVGGCAAGG